MVFWQIFFFILRIFQEMVRVWVTCVRLFFSVRSMVWGSGVWAARTLLLQPLHSFSADPANQTSAADESGLAQVRIVSGFSSNPITVSIQFFPWFRAPGTLARVETQIWFDSMGFNLHHFSNLQDSASIGCAKFQWPQTSGDAPSLASITGRTNFFFLAKIGS